MAFLVTALGLALVLEGLLYAAIPTKMQDMMRQLQNTPSDNLRIGGVIAIAIGVLIVWLSH